MKGIKNLAWVLIALVLTGCVARTKQFAPMPDQSQTVDNPEYARIYVIRPSSLGFAEKFIIGDGQVKIGNLGAESYLCWERPAGETELIGYCTNIFPLNLTMEKNKVYYILAEVYAVGFNACVELFQLTPEEGQIALQDCHSRIKRTARRKNPGQSPRPAPTQPVSVEQKLRDLKDLFEKGLITSEDYETHRKKILEEEMNK